MPVESLPAKLVMPAGEMVDAALAGLDQGELVTLPSLPNLADWKAYENARQALFPNLSRSFVGCLPLSRRRPGRRLKQHSRNSPRQATLLTCVGVVRDR